MSRHLIGLISVVALLSLGAPAGVFATGANPCAPKNPCAARESKNPCAVKKAPKKKGEAARPKNPCAAKSAGAAKNPCSSTK
ncbi:MAG: hypothetical protein HY293_06895 [Planctomycetes bacterium]|nr:hypothetical protein [Planctomycetota bacterium]